MEKFEQEFEEILEEQSFSEEVFKDDLEIDEDLENLPI